MTREEAAVAIYNGGDVPTYDRVDFGSFLGKVDLKFLKEHGYKELFKLMKHVESHGPLDDLIVLGTGVWDKDTPKRLTALNAYAGIVALIMGGTYSLIFSGGHTNENSELSEAEVAKNYVAAEFNEYIIDKIDVETESLTTLQNAKNTFPMVEDDLDVGMITSPNHLFRATRIFSKVLKKNGQELELALNSFKIVLEFLHLLTDLYPDLEVDDYPEDIRMLAYELQTWVVEFMNIRFLDDGGVVGQFIAAVINELPWGAGILEHIATKNRAPNTSEAQLTANLEA